MKRTKLIAGVAMLAAISFTSCKSVMTGSGGIAPHRTIITEAHSENEYDLNISETPITYTIDISTQEGQTKLHKLTVNQAKDLAYREAIMKYKCAVIHSPTYDYQIYGNRVIRITVYGFPAIYKNKE